MFFEVLIGQTISVFGSNAVQTIIQIKNPKSKVLNQKLQIQNPNPKSKTPNPKFQIPKSKIHNPKPQIINHKSQIPNPKSRILNQKSQIPNPKSKIPDQNSKTKFESRETLLLLSLPVQGAMFARDGVRHHRPPLVKQLQSSERLTSVRLDHWTDRFSSGNGSRFAALRVHSNLTSDSWSRVLCFKL